MKEVWQLEARACGDEGYDSNLSSIVILMRSQLDDFMEG